MTLKGTKFSKEHKKKISISNTGKKMSIEARKKMSVSKKKLGLKPPSNFGKKFSIEHRKKLGNAHKGEKNHCWKGGISFEPYGLEFNEDLKEVIRNRDRRKCQICKKTELENKEKLCIHHIDYDKRNNNPDNLMTLCKNCHSKTNFNRKYWTNYFNKKIWKK